MGQRQPGCPAPFIRCHFSPLAPIVRSRWSRCICVDVCPPPAAYNGHSSNPAGDFPMRRFVQLLAISAFAVSGRIAAAQSNTTLPSAGVPSDVQRAVNGLTADDYKEREAAIRKLQGLITEQI